MLSRNGIVVPVGIVTAANVDVSRSAAVIWPLAQPSDADFARFPGLDWRDPLR